MPEIGEWHSQPGRIFQGMACGLIKKESILQPHCPPCTREGLTTSRHPGLCRQIEVSHHVTSMTHCLSESGPELSSSVPSPGTLMLLPHRSETLGRTASIKGCSPLSGSQQTSNAFQFLRTCLFTVGYCFLNSIFKLFSYYFMTWFGQGCN